MSFNRIGLAWLLVAVVRVAAYGDAVILPSGERVEGKIVRENGDAVVIEVPVSSGIIDTRTYQKSEIKSVEKESADQIAYQEVATLKPGEESFMPSDYDRMIAQLRAFKRRFPSSSFLPVIEGNIQALTEEQRKVEEGTVKLNGKWLSAAEVQKNRYQIEARSLYGQMSERAQAGEYMAALNAFDAIEKQYPNSSSYPEAILLARRLIPALTADLARKKAIAARDEEQRQKGVEITSEPKKSQLIAAYESEQAQFKSLVEEATAAKIKWPPFIPRSPDSVEAVEKTITAEQTRLAGLDVTGMQHSLAAVNRAETALARSDLETTRQSIEAARSDWPTSEALKNVEEDLKAREAEMAAAEAEKKAAEAEAAAAPSPTPEPAASAVPQPTASPTPEAIEPEPTVAAVTPFPTVSPVEEAALSAPEEEPPFYKTIGGAVAILGATVLVAGVIAVLGKVKKPAQPEEPEA